MSPILLFVISNSNFVFSSYSTIFYFYCWDDEVNTKWSRTIECVGARDSPQPCMDRCFCSCLHGSFIISDRCENWYLVSPASAGGSGPVYASTKPLLPLPAPAKTQVRTSAEGASDTLQPLSESRVVFGYHDTTNTTGRFETRWMNESVRWKVMFTCTPVCTASKELSFVMEGKREIFLVLFFFSREGIKFFKSKANTINRNL